MLGSCLLGIRAMTSLPHCREEGVANASEMRDEMTRARKSDSYVAGFFPAALVRRDSPFLLNKEEYPAIAYESRREE